MNILSTEVYEYSAFLFVVLTIHVCMIMCYISQVLMPSAVVSAHESSLGGSSFVYFLNEYSLISAGNLNSTLKLWNLQQDQQAAVTVTEQIQEVKIEGST